MTHKYTFLPCQMQTFVENDHDDEEEWVKVVRKLMKELEEGEAIGPQEK